jgi:hypothetical protein
VSDVGVVHGMKAIYGVFQARHAGEISGSEYIIYNM